MSKDLMPSDKDFAKMRIFLRCVFAIFIFVLLIGMTKSCRVVNKTPVVKTFMTEIDKKERPHTTLWQTEI